MEATYPQNNPFGKLVIFGLILLAIVMAVTLIPHSVQRHGNDAYDVRRCIDGGGTLELWHRPTDNHIAFICQLAQTRFGVRIVDDNGEVTAFIKEKMRHLDQIQRYLQNRGYELYRTIKPPL